MRWGIRHEASLDQRTMHICLEAVRRCQAITPRPNFVVLLSERYGWRPLPAEIDAAAFCAASARVGDPKHRRAMISKGSA
jgi:hypothetical protein